MESQIKKNFENYVELMNRLAARNRSKWSDLHTSSELAVIDIIGRVEGPTVTLIAEHLGMTRGAISKITQKLLKEDLIEAYRLPDNRQKIYFRLKADGQLLFEKYTVWRDETMPSDEAFFLGYSEKKLHKIDKFMREYNAYLEELLKKKK